MDFCLSLASHVFNGVSASDQMSTMRASTNRKTRLFRLDSIFIAASGHETVSYVSVYWSGNGRFQ